MAPKLENISSISHGVRKILNGQCTYAMVQITHNSEDAPHETVHEIRKCFKKIRAILRLVRDTTDQYHTENKFFRDEARKISDVRDATALIEALDIIQEQFGNKLYLNAFSSLRTVLVDNRNRLGSKVLKHERQLKKIHQNLKPQCDALQGMSMDIHSYKSIIPGLKRTYKRGRKAWEKASETKSPKDFHEWRKRVKYLRYQLEAIRPIWPDLLDTWENILHDLSDFLGTDRDLLLLLNFLNGENRKQSDRNREEKSGYLTKTLIEGQRNQLQEHALLLGKKLYHLESGIFVSLIEAAWSAQLSIEERPLIPPESLVR